MRWDGLLANGVDEARATPPLPLALPNAVVRTFDTPGFAGMTFYEVRAKSIINRVPSQSRMPFEWTINPYRGCTHACVYCLAGDTPILMSGGRPKPLAEVRVGDEIVGTAAQGKQRRLVTTLVQARWSTVKPAYRLTLGDGTELVASADHRFLSDHGWRHTIVQTGRLGLAAGDRLVGTGAFAAAPEDSAGYRRGYLRGVIRNGPNLVHQFRLTLADMQALHRTRTYLADFGIATGGFVFRDGTDGRRWLEAVHADDARVVSAITALVTWPAMPDMEWFKGYLAGVFDAEGLHDGRALRIASADREVVDHASTALRHLGFDHVVEDRGVPAGQTGVRLSGGLAARLRFLHTVDSATTRKWAIEGAALGGDARVHVVSIEDLGLGLPMFDITTGTGDFIANGVVSHNCFARNTHTYLDLDAGRDFDSRVVVKVNAAELLRKELAATRWRGGHIAMGTNVDCYQRAEGKYRLMRDIIAALRDFANPFSILTKGTLITRDLDLLTQAARVTTVGLSLSIGFVDEDLWRAVEPGTPSPRRRLDTVRQLAEAGFEVGVLMAPILPGLSDTDDRIDATVRAIAAAGATSVVPISLHLRPGAREWYLAWLAQRRPDLVPHYQKLYGPRAYLPKAYQREVAARVSQAARRRGLRAGGSGETRRVPPKPAKGGRPVDEQLTLL